MPTVLRQGPYRFYWFSHEPGEPPHVHVDRDECSAKLWLRPVGLARNLGFPAAELRRIRMIVEANQSALLEAWNGHFGSQR
jgi:hypothetical protein